MHDDLTTLQNMLAKAQVIVGKDDHEYSRGCMHGLQFAIDLCSDLLASKEKPAEVSQTHG